MHVDKVILKAFISTLSAIALLFVFMFSVLALAFPSTMMQLSYDFGRDKSSIRYAQRAYDWFDDTYYMAYALEVAIGSDNQEMIEECGQIVVEDEAYFAQYCAEKQSGISDKVTMSYEDYLYGKIAIAKYEQGKKEEAVNYAFDTLKGGFARDNAVVALFYVAVEDKDTVQLIKGKMIEQESSIAEADRQYFETILAFMG